MLRAVTYCRCSTEEVCQQEALKKQVIEAKDSVKRNGWILVDEYIEAKSGTIAEKRREYQRLFQDLLTDKFDIVQIKSQDRLMRNTKDWYLFVDRLVTNNKKLYMYMEGKFYTPDDALITGIKAILAEEYSRELSKKINNAHRNRQQRGESFILPLHTYGYQRQADKTIAIVEEEAKVIRFMFYLCQTMGCGRIALTLEKEGYRDRKGKPFQEEAIRRIIRNPIRCGTVVQNKRHYDFQLKRELKMPKDAWVVHKDAIPAIVSEEIWKSANQAMDNRMNRYQTDGYHPQTRKGKYVLSGKIQCGCCKGIYYRTYRRGMKNESPIAAWKCQNYLKYGRKVGKRAGAESCKFPIIEEKGCDNIHLEEQKLLGLLEESCTTFYQRFEIDYTGIANKVLFALRKVLDKNEPLEKRRKIETEIHKYEMLSQKLVNKLMEDVISDDDYKRKKSEIEETLSGLRKTLQDYNATEDMHAALENRIKSIEEKIWGGLLDKAALSEMIEHIERIEVFDNRLNIQFYEECLHDMNLEGADDKNAFLLEIALNKEFDYAMKKEAEREKIITYMQEKPTITAKEIADREHISLTAANYRIKKLRQQGRIYFNGRGGHGEWVICSQKFEKKW